MLSKYPRTITLRDEVTAATIIHTQRKCNRATPTLRRFKRLFTWVNKQPRPSDPFFSGGGIDGTVPFAVTAIQCQVRNFRPVLAVGIRISPCLSLSRFLKSGLRELSVLPGKLQYEYPYLILIQRQ